MLKKNISEQVFEAAQNIVPNLREKIFWRLLFNQNRSIPDYSGSKLDNCEAYIHIIMFKDRQKNQFQKKLIVQNTNI